MSRNSVFCFASLFLVFILGSRAQSIQSGTVIIEFKAVNKNDVAINGTSRNADVVVNKLENSITISMDPASIVSDNIEFDEAIKAANFKPFEFKMIIDPTLLDFQSHQNKPVDVVCSATINDVTHKIDLNLLITSKKTNSMNHYILTGKGKIKLVIFNLLEKLPMLQKDIEFLFTQNITATY